LFEKESNFSEDEKDEIQSQLHEEMAEIFYGRNFS
jgi:S-adenosylmethionine decarboxylase